MKSLRRWNVITFHYVCVAFAVEVALAFVRNRPFPVVPIIGATNLDQLRLNIGSADLVLNEDVLADINEANRAFPRPF